MHVSNPETIYSAAGRVWGLNPGPADNRVRLSAHCANEPQRQSTPVEKRRPNRTGIFRYFCACKYIFIFNTYISFFACLILACFLRKRLNITKDWFLYLTLIGHFSVVQLKICHISLRFLISDISFVRVEYSDDCNVYTFLAYFSCVVCVRKNCTYGILHVN